MILGRITGADTSLSFFLSFFLSLFRSKARRKEVSDLERQLLREKRKSDAFEKTVICDFGRVEPIAIGRSRLFFLNKRRKDDDGNQKRSTNNNNRRQFDAFRRLLLKNVSEEDEAAFGEGV